MMRVLNCCALLGLLLPCLDASSATIRQLVEVVDINNVAVSPNGSLVAFRTEQATIERNTYRTVWYVQPVDGTTPPRRLGEGGDMLPDGGGGSRPERAAWSPDGRWIYFRAVHDGRIDVWRAAADGSRTEQLTHETANVRSFRLSAAGDTLFYSVGATRQAVVDAELSEYDRGIRIDRSVFLGQNLFRSGFHEGRLATQRLKNDFELLPLLADAPDRWRALDLGTWETREVAADAAPAAPLAGVDLPAVLGGVNAVAENEESGRIAILRPTDAPARSALQAPIGLSVLPDRTSRRPVRCTHDACTGKRITGVAWRPDSDEVVFTVTEPEGEPHQSVYRWNVADGSVRPVVHSRGQLVGGGRWGVTDPCAVTTAAMLCVAADSDAPPRLERVDLVSGARTVLFAPNALLAQDMTASVDVRYITWTDDQDRRYTGYFFPAPVVDGRPPPLFVVYYRCRGFLRGSVGDEWPLPTFPGHGIAALCINAAPYDDDAYVRYQQGLTAVESVVDVLAGQGEIDPARVGMGGLSFGSEVSMWMARYSDALVATSQSSPASSPTGSLLKSLGEEAHDARMQRFWQLGPPGETPERWKLLSPTFAIDAFRTPSLVQIPEQEYMHGIDYLVPLIRRQRLDLYVFPHEPHQKFQPRHKLAVYERNLDWFRFWLQGIEDDDARKRDQYGVWRSMRGARCDDGRESGAGLPWYCTDASP
ncbi:Atxe2 family lasso peptide isopeptidase [Luteimonas sp. SDU82]|uniref:Atxe2 family lasso peptide isopeptidase n=1 Tax=Luteimonas sp. SDU82 TaxID=3422592 RepID=UPI003EBD1F1C